MINTNLALQTYTPDQTAKILQLSKATVYDLISKGEILAKKIGKVYRIPASSLSFVFTGLDQDLYQAQAQDLKNLDKVQSVLKQARSKLK